MRLFILSVVIGILSAGTAYAGMPFYMLNATSAMRLDTLSFFIFLLLAVAWAFQKLWNYLREDFPRLPVFTYRRALAFILTLGFAFNLVLTMIAGARELMTPGAWERHGVTYRLDPQGK